MQCACIKKEELVKNIIQAHCMRLYKNRRKTVYRRIACACIKNQKNHRKTEYRRTACACIKKNRQDPSKLGVAA